MNNQQILKDKNGNELGVFIPMAEYNEIISKLEELEDIKDFDKAKSSNEATISLREAIKLRKNKNA
ncbi:MAG: hypothetical protein ACNS62_18655 [Candidatus Cyclobacteriaceae bacterium M3_2C_046]